MSQHAARAPRETLVRRGAIVLRLALRLLAAPLVPTGALTQDPPPVVRAYDRVAESAPARWAVDAAPSVLIGEVAGPEEYLLVNPLAAQRLSDGTLVIRDSNAGYFSLRYYDATGAHLTTVSRFGQGPFEFQYPRLVERTRGDSVFVLGQDGRFAVFGPRGGRVRDGRLDVQGLLPIRSGATFVDETHMILTKSVGPRIPPPGVQRYEALVLVWDLETSAVDTLGPVARAPSAYGEVPGRDAVYFYPYPFAPETSIVGGGGRIWIGRADLPEVRGYDAQGRLAAVVRFTDEPDGVGRGDRGRFRDQMLEGLSGETERRFAGYARSMEFPDAFPSFARLEVDRLGRLWVKRYEPPWAEGEQTWDVFGSDAEWVATVQVPAVVVPGCERSARRSPCDRLRDIGEEYVLVDLGDPRDVRRVGSFPIRPLR